MSIDLSRREYFLNRHIGPSEKELSLMLKTIGAASLDALMDETIPQGIRLETPLLLPEGISEHKFIKQFRRLASHNKQFTSFIGQGYYDTITPAVIQRNVLENPGWYTAYTPYQAEIAQGRLEALINFQTAVMDLTGMELANASLLDEATAAAEAMSLIHAVKSRSKKDADIFIVSDACHPQTIDVLRSRAEPLGIRLIITDHRSIEMSDPSIFGVLLQYPDTHGRIEDHSAFIESCHENEILVTVAADLLSLTLLKSPGEMGADVVVGSAQRFGVPMGYGGPHAAFFATREEYKRQIPGRIIGVSIDSKGNKAYRMALQTREQHIRREKATSNICTAQVLLAVMAGFYAVYHGPDGLLRIGKRVHGMARLLEMGLASLGYETVSSSYFDTLKITVSTPEERDKIQNLAIQNELNFRYFDDNSIGVALDQGKETEDIARVLEVFAEARDLIVNFDTEGEGMSVEPTIPEALSRKTPYLQHVAFNSYQSEHEMLRYIKRLENKDLSLVHSMISLGSCTMKLNATTEMIPLSWPEFGQMHPFSPGWQAEGYNEMNREITRWLCEITGFQAVSLQPNSGAQGELTGLLTIRAYHHSRGDHHRNVAIIPSSAHGTNPASAVMAGMNVVITRCDEKGNIDLSDLRTKVEKHRDNLAALMVTYPSTHGVFEEDIREICSIIHDNGGLVYMDGANMNAQVGLTSPARIGADVCHLNLHKTFCIPHGGGGPGMGPIAVNERLAPFLPSHPVVKTGGENGIPAVAAAPFGSASILTISYAYMLMMGGSGLTESTKYSILNANYIKTRLESHYKILYTGKSGRTAHEFIVDLREFKTHGIEVEDVAKRLMDYGYHAPTVSFPVPGTMMIEPTESETMVELDRFCDAMISIRREIQEIVDGHADKNDNVLKNAPHTADTITDDNWNHSYSREKAAWPLDWVRESKFWVPVSRVDSAYGDRNLICSCPPVEEFETAD
ncbi:MAG: aminomethyl-transferring glycine dehydrogenase [Cyclonatronaceae bacterium]